MSFDDPANGAYGLTFVFGDKPQTCDFQEGLRRHRLAVANLDHIFSKVRTMNKPDIRRIYDGTAKAPCAPSMLQLQVLFENFNGMADAGFMAHGNLPWEVVALVVLYGLDRGRCFVLALNQPQINLILGTLFWAAKQAGHDGYFNDYKQS
jgi:hypothetical protein